MGLPEFPGVKARGDVDDGVRLVQEWVTLNGCGTVVDGDFGPATERVVSSFQRKVGLEATGVVDEETFARLLKPMVRALEPIPPDGRGLGELSWAYALQHLRAQPREVGGQNRGPWVRLYMDGNEGDAWPWCAGFVTYVVRTAADALGVECPIPRTFSCDTLAMAAKSAGRFISEAQVASGETLPFGAIFLVRRTDLDWTHTGFARPDDDQLFETVEGNTNDDGHREGYEVCQRFRGYLKKDFISLA